MQACTKIANVAVGRSVDRIRLFVTCQGSLASSIKVYDKQPSQPDFVESTLTLPIQTGSQPFVGDLNGDFLEDLLYSESQPPHKLKVAYQTRFSPNELLIKDFDSLLVTDETEGCL